MQITQRQLVRAAEGVTGVAKIGSKERATVRKLAKLRARLVDENDQHQDAIAMLLRAHAKRDAEGQIVMQGQNGVAIENETAYNLALQEMMVEMVELPDDLAITESDLGTLVEYPDANVLSAIIPLMK